MMIFFLYLQAIMGRDTKEGMEVCDKSIPIYIYKWATVRQPTIPNFPYTFAF